MSIDILLADVDIRHGCIELMKAKKTDGEIKQAVIRYVTRNFLPHSSERIDELIAAAKAEFVVIQTHKKLHQASLRGKTVHGR